VNALDRKTKRGNRGRFLPGTAPGPGRPRREVERDYLRATADACPIDTWRQIVAKAVEQALEGDAPARAWLSKALLGEGTGGLVNSLTGGERVQLSEETHINEVQRMVMLFGPDKLDELLSDPDENDDDDEAEQ
jgi:hypothetical protein